MLLVLRLHIRVAFSCARIRHYFPKRKSLCRWHRLHRATDLNRGWLHRVMGVSPPRGSLAAALLAWSPFHRGLGLDGSIIVLFPCHCAAPRHRVLSADFIRSIPYSAVSVVINGHRGCLRASHSRLPAWFYPWLRLEENVQYRMDILFSRNTNPLGA